MTSRILFPLGYYPLNDRGRPVSDGKIYIGEVGQDPEENPKQVQGRFGLDPAFDVDQPITTNAGGVPELNGQALELFVEGPYSFKIQDKDGNDINYSSSVTGEVESPVSESIALTDENTSVVPPATEVEPIDLGNVYTGQFLKVTVSGTEASEYTVTGDYEITLTAGVFSAGDTLVAEQNGDDVGSTESGLKNAEQTTSSRIHPKSADEDATGTTAPTGTTALRHDTGSILELIYLWEPSGDFSAQVRDISSITANSLGGYDVVTTSGSFEFVTREIKTLRGVNSPTSELEVYIDGYGAATDGSDSAPALQAAIERAWDVGVNLQLDGSSVYVHTSAQIRCLGNLYDFASDIDAGSTIKSITVRGNGKTVFRGNATEPVFLTGTSVRFFMFEDIWFQNFVDLFHVSTSNLDGSMWEFNRCWFEGMDMAFDTADYDSSRSTNVVFNQCEFQSNCSKVGKFYVDQLTFNQCWFQHYASGGTYIEANSNVAFNQGIRIPVGSGGSDAEFLRFTNSNGAGGTTSTEFTRNVTFNGGRYSNEGGNTPLVVVDFEPVSNQGGGTPLIAFDGCMINGYHPSHFEPAGTETGIVHLLKYPAGVSFEQCSFVGLGQSDGLLVSIDSTLTDEPHDLFRIEMDDFSYHSAKQVGSYSSTALIADSMRGYINNPDPTLFRDVLEAGRLNTVDATTTGQQKATFKIRPNWNEPSGNYTAPMSFVLNLSGMGTATNNDINYNGTSVYLVTVVGFYDSSAKSRVTYTKLHGDTYGLNDNANADIISLHFGTAETGVNTAARASEYELTVVYCNNAVDGMATYNPMWLHGHKSNRYP